MPPPGWQPPVPQKSGPSGGLIAGIFAVVVVLLIGIGAVVFFVASGDDDSGDPVAAPSESTTEESPDQPEETEEGSEPTDAPDDGPSGEESDLLPAVAIRRHQWELLSSIVVPCDEVGESAVTSALIASGCQEVHVGLYVDSNREYAVTAGVIDCGDDNAAMDMRSAVNMALPSGWTLEPSLINTVFYFYLNALPEDSGIEDEVTQVQGSRDPYGQYFIYALGAGYDGSPGSTDFTWDLEFALSYDLTG